MLQHWDLLLPARWLSRLLRKVAGRLRRDGWGRHRFGREVIDALLLPSDILSIRRQYKHVFGIPPRLLGPRTFNEKLARHKILSHRERHTHLADKLAVRDLVCERIGPGILTQLFWTGLDLEDARRQHLPNRFVLKANHGCGWNVIVRDASLLDWEATKAMARRWLDDDYSTYDAEWQYRWIPRELLIEEYLEGPNGAVPFDYKFFCFHGRVEMVAVHVDRFGHHTQALLDRDFKTLPVEFVYPSVTPRYAGNLRRPVCYQQMRDIAECLASEEKFLRVDLYEVEQRPIFGELTLSPGGGLDRFEPPEWDKRWGALW